MGFIDNPVVSSLAGAIGLGNLTQAGNANPLIASGVPPPKITPKASPPNQPEYKEARFFDPRSPQSMARGGAPTGLPTEPGALSPDVQNNPTVMDLLQHFGVHPQQEIDPGLFIHNAHAWAAHPVMSGVLDGLLGGLANTKGSDTIGEGLSNVAQGLEATHDQKIAHTNAQLMAPYQQAMTVASLQDAKQKQDLQASTERYNESHADMMDGYWQGRENIAQTAAQAQVQKVQVSANAKVQSEKARPKSIDQSTWDAARQKHLVDMGVQPGQEPDADTLAKATQLALQDVGTAKQAPKTAGAIAVAKGTLGTKEALKATAPGSSAAAMVSANKNPDAQTKATYAQALKDYQEYNTAPPSKRGAMLGKMVVMPGSQEDKDELARRKSALAAATQSLPGGGNAAPPSAPSPKQYSPNNPYAR